MDIHFIVDEAGTIGYENAQKLIDFIKKYAYLVGPDKYRIGVTTMGLTARTHFWMNENMNEYDLLNALEAVPRYESE